MPKPGVMSDEQHPLAGLGQQSQNQNAGLVWQPWAMGGGEWKNPEVVRLCDEDVERIARRVVALLREGKAP